MRYEKYGFRNWAVYDDSNELICITVYKKGALEVIRRLNSLDGNSTVAKVSSYETKQLLKEIKAASVKIQKIAKELLPQLDS